MLARSRRRSFSLFRRQDLADLDDGDVVWNLLHGFNERGGELAIVAPGTEPYLAPFEISDVDEAGGSGGGAGSLVHGGGESGAVGDLVELLGAEVVEKNVQRKDVLDGVDGEAFSKQIRHSGIVDSTHSDGLPEVDLVGEVCDCEVVVEGGELRVLS